MRNNKYVLRSKIIIVLCLTENQLEFVVIDNKAMGKCEQKTFDV